MSSKSKRRGYAVEVQIRDKHISAGIPCERVPLSGSMGGKYAGDLAIPSVDSREFILECKARRNGSGFKVLEEWKKGKDILLIKRNNQDPMVVLDFDLYIKLMQVYYGTKTT
jgi:hypothetical protein